MSDEKGAEYTGMCIHGVWFSEACYACIPMVDTKDEKIKALEDVISQIKHSTEIQMNRAEAAESKLSVAEEALRRARIVIESALPGKDKARLGDWNKETVLSWIDNALQKLRPSQSSQEKPR